jgi:hypothetical protein
MEMVEVDEVGEAGVEDAEEAVHAVVVVEAEVTATAPTASARQKWARWTRWTAISDKWAWATAALPPKPEDRLRDAVGGMAVDRPAKGFQALSVKRHG